ncbi:MAG: hypothetical protein KAG66_21700, partial [Methylococcales bacterium]|nr:hypothetical protein [Methylococcales bacterium]
HPFNGKEFNPSGALSLASAGRSEEVAYICNNLSASTIVLYSQQELCFGPMLEVKIKSFSKDR